MAKKNKPQKKQTIQQQIGLRLNTKASFSIPNPEKEANKKACRKKLRAGIDY